ncbi:unnamed protein product [Prunus armeniaca]
MALDDIEIGNLFYQEAAADASSTSTSTPVVTVVSDPTSIPYGVNTIREPAPDAFTYDKWVMENAIVKCWLIGAMEPSVMNLFIRLPTAKNIWEAASHTYYECADRSIIYNLSRNAMETKQDSYKEQRAREGRDNRPSLKKGIAVVYTIELTLLATTISPVVSVTSTPYGDHGWILDSGATNHMTFDASRLHYNHSPACSPVGNVTGVPSPVTSAGSVDLSPSLTLDHTLLLPTLSNNL